MLHFEVKDEFILANDKKILIRDIIGCRVISNNTKEENVEVLYDQGITKFIPKGIHDSFTLYSVIIDLQKESFHFRFQEDQLDEIINECKKINKNRS